MPTGVQGSGAGHVEHQPAEVGRVQAVGVLGRVHRLEDGVLVDVPRQRQLDDVAGARRVGVELVDDRQDVVLGRRRRQLALDAGDADLRRSPCAWR